MSVSEKTPAQNETRQNRLEALSTLLVLEQRARHRRSIEELFYMIVNETMRSVPYRQAVLWTIAPGGQVKVGAVSGVSSLDAHSPFSTWFCNIVGQFRKKAKAEEGEREAEDRVLEHIKYRVFTPDDLDDEEDRKDWAEWLGPCAVFIDLFTIDGVDLGGLWLDRNEPLNAAEKHLVLQICDTYIHAWDRLRRDRDPLPVRMVNFVKSLRARRAAFAVILLVLLFPVPMSVTAPAEVVARDPFVISSPMDGVIADILVQPNEEVKAGTVLATLDDTGVKNQVNIKAKAWAIARAAYAKTAREAFSDQQSKSNVALLQAEAESKKIEYDYARQLMQKTQIKAPRDGVALFSDPNALRGMPVRSGERIMLLTAPEDTALRVRIPAGGMIHVNHEAPVRLFLNIAPLESLRADVKTVSYEASPDPDGLLTYKLRGSFPEGEKKPRVGLSGTARVYGGYTIFAYQMLRRPITVLRRMIGW